MKLKVKYLIERMIKFALKLFSVFAVKKNKVLFQSFSGRQYSDSPRAVSEYLLKRYPGQLEIIWAFTDPASHQQLKAQGIKTVKYKSLRYLYHALSCRVYVDNVEPWSILHFRPGQKVINTWHGGGTFKQVGIFRKDIGEREKQHVVDKMRETDWFLSSSKAFSQQTIRESFRYQGEILECGLPRNDRLINPKSGEEQEIREKLKLDERRIVLYAPTFRNDLISQMRKLDVELLLKSLGERFGGQWQLLVRWHYYLTDRPRVAGAVDVSDYPEMNDLLMISEVLVTDYSSSIWDYSLLKRPCFLYCPDIEQYGQERSFYSDMASWPALAAYDNEQLRDNILNYDESSYLEKLASYHQSVGIRESGRAAEEVGELIRQLCLK